MAPSPSSTQPTSTKTEDSKSGVFKSEVSKPEDSKPEKTFTAFTAAQAASYAQIRPDYNDSVYEYILTHHSTTGGLFDLAVDIGTGPGTVARHLAPSFKEVVGIDPSEGMISTARSLTAFHAKDGGLEGLRFEVSTAESLSTLFPDGTVDLIIAANAAHWFNLPSFWRAAARVLKPGGTVALSIAGEVFAHPSLPNSTKIQAAIDDHVNRYLLPYFEKGNHLARSRYEGLTMPWDVSPVIPDFPRTEMVEREWGFDEDFTIAGGTMAPMRLFEKGMKCSSPQVRYDEAHPETTGTDLDPVRLLRGRIEEFLREGGVKVGEEMFRGASRGRVLVLKRR